MRGDGARRGSAVASSALVALMLLTACTPTADDPPTPGPSTTPTSSAKVESPTATFGAADPAGDDARAELRVVVGVDVVPGVYRTVDERVPDGMDGGILFDRSCTFGQYSDSDGGLDALIAGGTADGGHPTVTLGDGQLFRTQRCGAWELVDEADLFDAPDVAPTTVTDGMWLVGEDLRPGTYRTEHEFTGEYVEGAFCGWEVDSTWTDWDSEVLAVEFAGPGPGEVTLQTGQQFVSLECGTWRLQPSE
ncbi:hypothetical protein [Cellulomonas sp. KRMCY2]|uniref:hypothetical protein n=1 Tax=Cellulomonas sp. KRMCY2 TaxID=1304865 RepID=UPI00045EC581|nr:hypothetical protein [Cellulomonas sp. KRMCY2]